MFGSLRCQECESHPAVTDVTYDGVRLECDCPGLGKRCVVSLEALSNAPRAWVYESPRSGRLKHVGDYVTTPEQAND